MEIYIFLVMKNCCWKYSRTQLTYHEPGMTYRTSNDLIKVSSTGQLTTYFSTTTKVYVYRNGVLDHTITVIVGQG